MARISSIVLVVSILALSSLAGFLLAGPPSNEYCCNYALDYSLPDGCWTQWVTEGLVQTGPFYGNPTCLAEIYAYYPNCVVVFEHYGTGPCAHP